MVEAAPRGSFLAVAQPPQRRSEQNKLKWKRMPEDLKDEDK